MHPDEFIRIAHAIESELARVIVGQREVVRAALIGIFSGRHILLEGVPGLGKTLLIRAIADVLDMSFARIQFTPDLMPADITGTDILEEGEDGRRGFRFQHGAIFANLVLADEINRATPKTQSAMLEAMQEKTVTVAGKRYPLEEPFFVMATQNPLEMEGTYPLPEAQLDRFLFKVLVPFPPLDDLVTILERTTGAETPQLRRIATADDVLRMRALALALPVASHITRAAARLVVASHPQDASAPARVKQFVAVGASPRGAQALLLGAKVTALLEGRYNVAWDDVVAVAKPALRHRILLNFVGQAEPNLTTDALIADLLASVRP